MKGKDKQIETNFIDEKYTMDPDDPFFDDYGAVPLKHFDVSNFFKDTSGKIDHLIEDGNVCYDCDIRLFCYFFLCYFLFHTVFPYSYL